MKDNTRIKNYYYNLVKENLNSFEEGDILTLEEICKKLRLYMTYSTTTRNVIMSALESFFVIKKLGKTKNRKYLIKSIRKEFAECREDQRGIWRIGKYKYNISDNLTIEDWESRGIYAIIDKAENEIYIGETMRSFRYRIREHFRNYNDCSWNTQRLLLRDGVEVSILHKMNDVHDENLFLQVEKEFQDMYKEMGYTVIKNGKKESKAA